MLPSPENQANDAFAHNPQREDNNDTVIAADNQDGNPTTPKQAIPIGVQASAEFLKFRDEQATILQQTASTQAQVSALGSTSHEEHAKFEAQMKSLALLVEKQSEATAIKVASKMTDVLTKQNASAAEKINSKVASVLESQRSSDEELILKLNSAMQYKFATVSDTITSRINDSRGTPKAPTAARLGNIGTEIANSTIFNTEKEIALWHADDLNLLKMCEFELIKMEEAPAVSSEQIKELRGLADRQPCSPTYIFDNIIGNILSAKFKSGTAEQEPIVFGLVREQVKKADLKLRERRAEIIARCDKLKARHSKSLTNLYGLLSPRRR